MEFIDYNGNTVTNILNHYTIGSLFITTTNTNPGTFIGGTWVSYGSGRTIVGVDVSQTEFNTANKTGGSKFFQEHAHSLNNFRVAKFDHVNQGGIYVSPAQRFFVVGGNLKENIADAGTPEASLQWYSDMDESQITISNAGEGSSGNLQPYITVYMWKRTA